MKKLSTVILAGLDIRIRPALIEANRIWNNHGQELMITCGLNGVHSPGSLHYYGLAIDVRTSYFGEQKQNVYNDLYDALKAIDERFDIVLHSTHIHIEYDIIKKI